MGEVLREFVTSCDEVSEAVSVVFKRNQALFDCCVEVASAGVQEGQVDSDVGHSHWCVCRAVLAGVPPDDLVGVLLGALVIALPRVDVDMGWGFGI